MANTWGLINTFGVFQTYYQTVMLTSTSASSISWIGSLQACLAFLVGLVAGPLFDAGYSTASIVIGQCLITFGMFMTSLCHTYWQVILAQGICVGLGMGLTFLPAPAVLGQYFAKKRTFAIGIASTGSPIAGIIFPIIFSRLLPKVGFGWATRVIAFIVLAFSLIPVTCMRTRLPSSGKVRSIVDRSAIRDAAFMSFAIGTMLAFLVLYTAFFYIQDFDELNHFSSLDFAPYTVTLLNAGSIFGRLLPTYISDKVGVVNVTIACTFGSGILVLGWMGLRNLAGIVVFVILYGATSGGVTAASAAAIMVLSPDMSRVGARMGMAYAMSGVFVLVGTPIAGAIFGDFSRARWLGGMGYAAAGLILGSAFMVGSWVIVHRRKGGWKI